MVIEKEVERRGLARKIIFLCMVHLLLNLVSEAHCWLIRAITISSRIAGVLLTLVSLQEMTFLASSIFSWHLCNHNKFCIWAMWARNSLLLSWLGFLLFLPRAKYFWLAREGLQFWCIDCEFGTWKQEMCFRRPQEDSSRCHLPETGLLSSASCRLTSTELSPSSATKTTWGLSYLPS